MTEAATTADTMHVRGFGVLSTDPAIVHIFRYTDDILPNIAEVCRRMAGRNITFLVSSGWSLIAQAHGAGFRRLAGPHHALLQQFPGTRIVYLANDAAEQGLLAQFGYETVLCQHNAFLSPADYVCKDDEPAADEHDSIYLCKLQPFKRVELMERLRNAAMVYASWDEASLAATGFDEQYWARVQPKLGGVTLLNGVPLAEPFRPMTRSEVLAQVRRARVGLCLSDVDGAVFSGAEYLLSGLPVVSTYAVGGRDTYWDSQTCRVCEPDPGQVAGAVARLIYARLSPRDVRARAVETTLRLRLALIAYLRESAAPGTAPATAFYSGLLNLASRYAWRRNDVAEVVRQLEQAPKA